MVEEESKREDDWIKYRGREIKEVEGQRRSRRLKMKKSFKKK